MSDKSNEQISNLMDGELEVNASKFLLKRMAADESLSKTWENYHLIKSCLQKETQEPLVIDVASKVSAALGMQNQEVIIEKPQVNRWLKPVMGFGIAASVAFMSIVMLQQQQVDQVDPIILTNNIANVEINNSVIKPKINAKLVTGDKSIVPPPFLSRYPSVTAKNSYQYTQGYNKNYNTPYIIIINPKDNKPLSPMRIKDVSD